MTLFHSDQHSRSRRDFLRLGFAVPFGCRVATAADPPLTPSSLGARIRDGLTTLDRLYWSPTLKIWLDRPGDDLRGHFDGRVNPPWWSAANAVEWLIDFMNATGTDTEDRRLRELHELHREPMKRWPAVARELERRGQWHDGDEDTLRHKHPKAPNHTEFRNEYLDDSGWWGLAWLKMAERTGDARFLVTAKTIHAHMAGKWLVDGGGVIWCDESDKRIPNTITNTLFLILSGRLAQHTGEARFREWAEKTYAWVHQKALFDGTGVIDGPGGQGDWWSYNQGTYLGGLLAFAEMTGSTEPIEEAARVAGNLLTEGRFVAPDGVLIENRGTAGWDGGLFKGILARYLGQLRRGLKRHNRHPETVARIDATLAATAAAIVANGLGVDGQFVAEWHLTGTNHERNFNTHLSALIALTAALPSRERKD